MPLIKPTLGGRGRAIMVSGVDLARLTGLGRSANLAVIAGVRQEAIR